MIFANSTWKITFVAVLIGIGMAMAGCGSQASEKTAAPAAVGEKTPVRSEGTVDISFLYTAQNGIASNQFAVWIEDSEGKYIKTLYVTQFAGTGGYAKQQDAIPMWVAKSQVREGKTAEIDAAAGATPLPGDQKFVWDCTGKDGQPVPQGEYMYVVEGSLRWKNHVVYSGTIQVGSTPNASKATAQYEGGSTAERGMIGTVQAMYTPAAKNS
ncbi:DUF2271 domain-containing protein [Megasphaera cerevisiae]|uniref:DUF2271 domain-containing protein n=1 Tax=Megasphaera cerevisiae TaxID=39029 RepID=UPI0009F8A4D0|nr:DUF2271 domain-containing protein [Megasphaera cerevisiae]